MHRKRFEGKIKSDDNVHLQGLGKGMVKGWGCQRPSAFSVRFSVFTRQVNLWVTCLVKEVAFILKSGGEEKAASLLSRLTFKRGIRIHFCIIYTASE